MCVAGSLTHSSKHDGTMENDEMAKIRQSITAYRKTSNKCPRHLFVHLTKKTRCLIETQHLLETWCLFLSCTNGKILVPVSQEN